jgi:hypothetical protein
MPSLDTFKTRAALTVGGETIHYYSLPALAKAGYPGVDRLPYSLKILLENLLRREDNAFVKTDDIRALAGWDDRRRLARRKCPSCRRGCCCRTSPACRVWSTSRPCATASSRWAAIRTR